MALGRKRNNKRSSSDSYVFTTTTLVFICLCGLAVWILNSDSVDTPQSATRTSTATSDESNEISKPNESTVTTVKQREEMNKKPFEDNPRDLPEDALKNDEPQKSIDDPKKKKGSESDEGRGGKDSVEEHAKQNEHQMKFSEESSVTQKQSIQDNARDESADLDSQRTDQGEEGKNGGRDQQNQNNQSNDDEKQKNENQQQQSQDGKTITFSDEMKKDTTKQDNIKEEARRRHKKDETKQQEKQLVQQGESDSDSTAEAATPQLNKQEATDDNTTDSNSLLNTEIPKESNESKKSWLTQAGQSRNEKQRRKEKIEGHAGESLYWYSWKLCNVTAGPDYIPCLDNEAALKRLRTTKHYEHRERHCPDDSPTCLVPLPSGYKPLCHSLPKMNMRLKSNLRLRGAYLLYLL